MDHPLSKHRFKYKRCINRKLRKLKLSRRQFLLAGLRAVGSSCASHAAWEHWKDDAERFAKLSAALFVETPRNFEVTGDRTLNERAAKKGVLYGAATSPKFLFSNPPLAPLAARECGILVPENDLKWKQLRPNPNEFDFTAGDQLLKFAQQHSMKFRGHTLVWHENLPMWLREQMTSKNAAQLLVNHIQTVVKHYAGKVHSWDVVNEAIKLHDGVRHGLRGTVWLENLGENYIDIAFRTAAEADPNAMLVYNDLNLDGDSRDYENRRTAVLRLLERLKSRGTPVQALGIQGHWRAWEDKFKPEVFRRFLKEVASMGLKIMITEMDVSDRNLPFDIARRDRIVAGIYEDYLSVALDERNVIAVLTWGMSDRYTWLTQKLPRKDRAAVRPLPWDENFNRKLAWNAIARAFDSAPTR
jgi:endo-1,4-beta-xylanase